eukprot:14834560-Alexandrium_andersonii.AAC.1
MSASLVGSEMCIRDSLCSYSASPAGAQESQRPGTRLSSPATPRAQLRGCLLYTSDAADDM